MLIESGSKNPKKNVLSEFMKKNKSMVFLLPVLLIGIIVVVVMYTKPQNKPKPKPAVPSSTTNNIPGTPGSQDMKVDVLPQMERVKQPEDMNLSEVTDPFSTGETGEQSLFLKGIILSEDKDTAIIETASRAYIVSVGDSIDSFWHVASIEEDRVILTDSSGSSLILALK